MEESTKFSYGTLLQNYGISSQNIAKATGIYIGMSYSWALVLWGLCFIVSPSKRIMTRIPSVKVKNIYKRATEKANERVKKIFFLKNIPEENSGKITISLVEMLIFKAMLNPVVFPLKLWLTIKLTKMNVAENAES